MATHSFEDIRPFARYDDVPWELIRTEEAPTAVGPWVEVDSQVIPVDATPATPDLLNITVTTATNTSDYFRFRFDVSPTNPSPYTPVIFSPAQVLPIGVVYYTTPDDVRAWLNLDDSQLTDEALARVVFLSQIDIDSGAGSWTPFEDTGLKFASNTEDVGLTDRQVLLLSRATCQQVEYRLTVGEDFMIKEQYESESGPDGQVNGKLKKLSSYAYATLASAGLLRLNTGHVSKHGHHRRRRLPSA